jgi:adenosylcobinamide-GDP ribazoletransferase
MRRLALYRGWIALSCWVRQFAAAMVFYTCLPLPPSWPYDFRGIARYAPLVGLVIGGLLGIGDGLLVGLGVPLGARSALVIVIWLGLTGGLHLDGAMDTADGLAVMAPERRLQVMADSRSGAFGVMAAIALLGLKLMALVDLHQGRWFVLMAAAAWGRWGQVVAIARYPYLKPEGKGAFHKTHAHPRVDWILGWGSIVGLSLVAATLGQLSWLLVVGVALGGMVLAISTAAWFHRQLGGHTGDTYGAVVEWTEALLLCCATALQ